MTAVMPAAMPVALRRGACPSLAAPMRTGDGWLARLVFDAALTGPGLAALAGVAARLGNGVIEITARGSVQIRGLAEGARLAEALAPLGLPLAEGVPVVLSPLAGRDPTERADPRPLAAALRRFAGPLPPKAGAVVDGGGGFGFGLDEVAGDVRLLATADGWRVGVGGTTRSARWFGAEDADAALARALGLLGRMSREGRRGRELDGLPGEDPPSERPAPPAAGRLGTGVRAVAFPFGIADSDAVAALAAAAGDAALCPASGRSLVAIGLADAGAFVAAADRLGFVTDPGDPRLGIAACAGAPACASGRIATKAIAARLAAAGAGRGVRLHVSGCAKRCAQPTGPAVTLVAEAAGLAVTGDGCVVPPGLERSLLEAAAW